MAALTIEFPQTVWTVEFGGDETVVQEVTMTGGTGGGGFDGVHNDLDGRSTADAHPISAITGLTAALEAGGASALADLTDVDVETDPPAPDDVLAWDGTNWTPATLDGGSGLELGETSTTAYRGDRGKTAYDHSQVVTGNPHGTAIGDISGLQTAIDAKAPLASPTFTGTPAAPTAAQGTNTTQVATTAYVQTEVGLMVPKSVVDAAGDLLVGTGADAVGKLTLGTRGHTLVAGASAPEYRAIGSVRSFGGMPPKAGEWVLLGPSTSSGGTDNIGTTTNNSNNVIRYVPFEVFKRTGVAGLGLAIATGNAGGSAVLRLGIHESSDGRPGVVLAQGTAGLGSTGAKEITWTEVFLEPGWYWAALGMQSLDTAGTNPAFRLTGGAMAQSSQSSVPTSSTAHNQRLHASVSGSLADNPTVSQEPGSAMPALFLKVSTP